MLHINRRQLLAATGVVALPAVSWAAAYPERPIRFVVPNPPGGPSDIVARVLAESMRTQLGQSIVIDNRAGATGMIGTSAVVNATADGYTVLVTSRSNHVVAPMVQHSTIDPQRDLAPVGLALKAAGIFVTPRSSPFNSIGGLVSYAKAHPGKLFYGSAGIGSVNHVDIELFKSLAGIDLVHVPYKGSGNLMTGLMTGEVSLAICDFSTTHSAMAQGAVLALAQTGLHRLSSMANVPTLREAGFPSYDPSFWVGLAAPRDTPSPVVARLNTVMNAALADVATKARAQVYGWELLGGTPDRLSVVVREDLAVYSSLVQRLDIKAG